jgi:hypothetical protein
MADGLPAAITRIAPATTKADSLHFFRYTSAVDIYRTF